VKFIFTCARHFLETRWRRRSVPETLRPQSTAALLDAIKKYYDRIATGSITTNLLLNYWPSPVTTMLRTGWLWDQIPFLRIHG